MESYFLDCRKAEEPNGKVWLDNLPNQVTAEAFGSTIQSIHYVTNCLTLVAGGAVGIRLGEHVVAADEKKPVCNLWLTLLRGVGLKVASYGDSTGVLPGLVT